MGCESKSKSDGGRQTSLSLGGDDRRPLSSDLDHVKQVRCKRSSAQGVVHRFAQNRGQSDLRERWWCSSSTELNDPELHTLQTTRASISLLKRFGRMFVFKCAVWVRDVNNGVRLISGPESSRPWRSSVVDVRS